MSLAEDAAVVLLICVSTALAFVAGYAYVGAGWMHSTFDRFVVGAPLTVVLCCVLLGLPKLLSKSSQRLVSGSPRYSYLSSTAHQLFVFPCCLCVELWAVAATGSSAGDYLHSSWAGASPGRLAGHATLLAYWLADLITTPKAESRLARDL